MNDLIAFNRASFHGDELTNLAQSLLDGRVAGNGPFTERDQAMLDERHGSGHRLLTSSCTSALEISAQLLDLKPGDEVIVPDYTFVTSASAFMLHGATPVLVDVREDTLNLDPPLVEAAITPRTRTICIVNHAGVGATPDVLRALADRLDPALIEDNALGLSGTYNDEPLGTFGQASTLSFRETKTITCGEGGSLHLNDLRLIERAEILREKGTDRAEILREKGTGRAEILREKGTDRSQFLRGAVQNYTNCTSVDVGSSWEVSDLLAGVLVAQLVRLPLHAGLDDNDLDRVIQGVIEFDPGSVTA